MVYHLKYYSKFTFISYHILHIHTTANLFKLVQLLYFKTLNGLMPSREFGKQWISTCAIPR